MCQRPPFRRGQKLADAAHHAAGIGTPLGLAPHVELFGQISGRLTGKRRIGRTDALSLRSMAGGTCRQATGGIACVVKWHWYACFGTNRSKRQTGIVSRYGLALGDIELLRNPAHLRVVSATVRKGFKLPLQIAGVQIGQSRRTGAVASSIETVASEAGILCAGSPAADGDQASGFREPVKRRRLGLNTTRDQGQDGEWKQRAHPCATVRSTCLFRLARFAALLLMIAACKPPPEQRQLVPLADAGHGSEVIKRVGCGSCHAIPGIFWPKGKVGPPLVGLKSRALIGGKLPNQPDILAAYIQNAPALVAGSGMPAMPVTEAEARDIAAYLYQQEDR